MALGRVIKSIASPAADPTGLTWDGESLWVCDLNTDIAYQINPTTGTAIPRFGTPSVTPRGLAYDGKYLWHSNAGSDRLYQIDPNTGSVVYDFPTPAAAPMGLAYDGEYLWSVDAITGLFYQISPVTGTAIPRFAALGAAGGVRGLTYDGKYLWFSHITSDRIYKIDPATGVVVAQFTAPDSIPHGLAYDGEYLWVVGRDSDLIYQIEVTPSIIASAIRALGPIAQWGLWEAGGAVAYDISGNSPAGERNGAHVGITHHDAPGPGDGSMAPLYDGANDYTDILTASLIAAFNGAQGSLIIYIKVFNAGVWTDGSTDDYFRLEVDVTNRIIMRKTNVNNTMLAFRTAGGVPDSITSVALGGRIDFISSILTWDTAADQLIWYTDGTQEGAIQVGLGIWAGALSLAVIGAASLVPGQVWNGWLSQGAVIGRVITPAEIRGLPRGGP